jgi:hypothetical protein
MTGTPTVVAPNIALLTSCALASTVSPSTECTSINLSLTSRSAISSAGAAQSLLLGAGCGWRCNGCKSMLVIPFHDANHNGFSPSFHNVASMIESECNVAKIIQWI